MSCQVMVWWEGRGRGGSFSTTRYNLDDCLGPTCSAGDEDGEYFNKFYYRRALSR